MSEVRVDAATTDDLDSLSNMWVELIRSQRQYGTHLLAGANRAAAREFLARYVAADQVQVARASSAVIGFVMYHVATGVYDQDTTRGVVDNVYVRPAHQGRGVGSRLLDAAEAALAEAGVETLAISVLAANEGARRLYERRGYRPHRIELERAVESDTHSTEDG